LAQWQSIPKSWDQRQQWQFSGGVNTGNDSFDIKDNQSVDEFGWDTDDDFPALVTSNLPLLLGTSGAAITRLLAGFGNLSLIRQVGTNIQKWDGSTWTNIGTFSDVDGSACNFDILGQALILSNGTDTPQYWNGTAMTAIAAMPKAKYITSDNLRVFAANAAGDQSPDLIHYCKYQDATDWTAPQDSGIVQYYSPSGGEITGMITFSDRIWVFKKDSFARIFHTGDPNTPYRLVPSTDNIGCVNGKTIVQVGTSLFWLGNSDVFIGEEGSAMRIGEPIRAYLNRINQSQIAKCNAWTDGLRYYLNLVLDSATEPNYRFVWDTRYRIWRVAQINEQYRYGTYFNGLLYAGNTAGETYQINAIENSNSWMIESKDFDRSEQEKEYHLLYLQCSLATGGTLQVEASTDRGNTWTTIGDPITSNGITINDPIIVPLDTLPLGCWGRFRISGTGNFKLYSLQRHFRLLPLNW
jgi:hypothetical protein